MGERASKLRVQEHGWNLSDQNHSEIDRAFDELDTMELFPFRMPAARQRFTRELAFERCVILWLVFD
jgi:hypothetical protein